MTSAAMIYLNDDVILDRYCLSQAFIAMITHFYLCLDPTTIIAGRKNGVA